MKRFFNKKNFYIKRVNTINLLKKNINILKLNFFFFFFLKKKFNYNTNGTMKYFNKCSIIII